MNCGHTFCRECLSGQAGERYLVCHIDGKRSKYDRSDTLDNQFQVNKAIAQLIN
jgi:hypothetical protein